MIKIELTIIAVLLLMVYGCSNQPVTPDRVTSDYNPEVKTFQLALVLAGADYPDPSSIPTDVPTIELIDPAQFGYFASYALAAFDVYYEPSDWDDWLESATIDRGVANYEPSDWDDWMVSYETGNGVIPLRRATESASSDNDWLVYISKKIDPLGAYEPSDWDDWLESGAYEPSDWDDWLTTATIDDLTNLN